VIAVVVFQRSLDVQVRIQRDTGCESENWQERYREMPVDIETTEGIIAVAENNVRAIVAGSLPII
jgi:hypothetical protein